MLNIAKLISRIPTYRLALFITLMTIIIKVCPVEAPGALTAMKSFSPT